jgi:hypothetical protein
MFQAGCPHITDAGCRVSISAIKNAETASNGFTFTGFTLTHLAHR